MNWYKDCPPEDTFILGRFKNNKIYIVKYNKLLHLLKPQFSNWYINPNELDAWTTLEEIEKDFLA